MKATKSRNQSQSWALLVAALAMSTLPACDQIQAAKAVTEDVQAEYGVQASVRVSTGMQGKVVFIALPTMPTGEPTHVKARITEIAKKRVPDADDVVINSNL